MPETSAQIHQLQPYFVIVYRNPYSFARQSCGTEKQQCNDHRQTIIDLWTMRSHAHNNHHHKHPYCSSSFGSQQSSCQVYIISRKPAAWYANRLPQAIAEFESTGTTVTAARTNTHFSRAHFISLYCTTSKQAEVCPDALLTRRKQSRDKSRTHQPSWLQ